jgi:hypothetical protein
MSIQQHVLKEIAQSSLGSLNKTGQVAVFEQLDSDVQAMFAKGVIDRMTPEERRNFLLQYPEVPASSAQPECQEITLQGSPAIEIHVQVNGQTVRAVLSDASFKKSRTNQNSYAEGLGGRLATREENIAVANALLEKEEQGNLNPAEAKLLKTYREKWVRDSEGGLDVDGRRVNDGNGLDDYAGPSYGVLVVLSLAESK